MSGSAGVGRRSLFAWPRPVVQLAVFLRSELAAFPGRGNVVLRCVIASAIVIVASMTLQVPELAVSLIAVFFVTQANVVMTRLVGLLLLIGVTCAVACTIGVYQLTFDYPLLRIVIASAIFFWCVYLMRAVSKLGLVFFLVSLVVIYAQTFADLTDNAEALVRSCLWVWVAVAYPVTTALIINTLLLPAEPERQLRAAMQRQLAMASTRLAALTDAQAPAVRIGPLDLQRGALVLQKLLRFATMRRRIAEQDESAMLAWVTTVSRVLEAAAALPDAALARGAKQVEAIRVVQGDLVSLDRAIGDDAQWPRWHSPARAPVSTSFAAVDAMQRALDALRDATPAAAASRDDHAGAAANASDAAFTAKTAPPATPAPPSPPADPGLFANPRYARFALRTLLSVLICYVFYNAVNWPGIHTVMLTCLVVALPSLGASSRHGLLRISGALTGSALALFMVAFVIPHLESVTGLLLMSLPVIALGAWVSAGSERISYAGIQIMFTFALALLESYSPPSDLTEIRDRMVGILLGVAVATFIQMSLWPEGEADALRAQLASVLREIAMLARAHAKALLSGGRAMDVQPASATWAKLAECDAVLARVALEPDWREGETAHVTLQSQTVLAQTRALLVALEAFSGEATADARISASSAQRSGRFQLVVADTVERYAAQLEAEPPAAITPAPIGLSEPRARPVDAGAEVAARADALELHAQRIGAAFAGLPQWTARSHPPGEPALAG